MAVTGHPASDLRGRPSTTRIVAGALCAALGGVLALGMLDLPRDPAGLTREVKESLELSEVSHPTTAVLLNFRGYDTLLEVGVLLVAVVAVFALRGAAQLPQAERGAEADAMLGWAARLLTPIIVLIGGYLLWLGVRAPGGAFQAGAILGSAGVLLRIAGYRSVAAIGGWGMRAALTLGFGVFLVIAAGLLFRSRMLEFPADRAGSLILVIEVAITLSVAATLALLFITGAPAAPRERDGSHSKEGPDS